MANMKRLGTRLRALREANGHTQSSLSRDTHVSQNYISSLERGEIGSPDMEILCALFGKLGLTPNDIAETAGWWSPTQDHKVPRERELLYQRLEALPPADREPLVTILSRMVNATYKDGAS